MAIKSHYDILGVTNDATEEQIKNIYRKLSLAYHPDKNPNQLANKKFKEINEAYDTLINKESREKYDKKLLKDIEKEKKKEIEQKKKEAELKKNARLSKRMKEDTPVITKEIFVSYEKLLRGCVKNVTIQRLQKQKNGEYKPKKTCFEVQIRPGWKDGTEITFEKEGHQLAIPGDVTFIVRVKKHKHFTRKGDDLVYVVRLNENRNHAGKIIKIPRLCDKPKQVRITKEVKNGTVMQFPNEGLPNAKRPKKRGNLRVVFQFYDTFCFIPIN